MAVRALPWRQRSQTSFLDSPAATLLNKPGHDLHQATLYPAPTSGMTNSPPNLFNSLFEFHPRDGHTPKENFLSEAFAYVLATCDAARDAWLSRALGRPVRANQFEVTTRQSEHDEDFVSVFPDMRIQGVLDDETPFDIYSEHKWNSHCNPGQLRRYLKLVSKHGNHSSLVFIGASRCQKKEAEKCDARLKGKAFLWSDVFEALELINAKSDLLVQFLDFMKTHGLSPGTAIQPSVMVAYIQSTGFLASLVHCANKLNDDFEWDCFPARYRTDDSREVRNRWGRVAIEFTTPGWKPTISVGFLFDEYDHGVTFVNRQKGIDLFLRIETAPGEQKHIAPALVELDRKRKKLANLASSVLLLNESGNDNSHSLLIMRSCLADVIQSTATQPAQLETIHATVSGWADALFDDGALEGVFKQAGLDSGMTMKL